MDAMIRSKAEVLAREVAGSISTQQELSELMRFMTKSVIERMLDAELDVHWGQPRKLGSRASAAESAGTCGVLETLIAEEDDDAGRGESLMKATVTIPDESRPIRNRRNGRSPKTVQGESGKLVIATPRDRLGTFEPLLISKHERRMAGFDDKN